MQYLAGILWFMYIVHALRRSFAEHHLARTLEGMWKRLGRIREGMSTADVRYLLGGPDRINAGAEMTIWQYRIADQFKSIRFSHGKVIDRDQPSPREAGELKGLDLLRS